MNQAIATHRFDTIVIGGGQAGLAVGYYLAQQRRTFVNLDASPTIGATWRDRWDSLKLFTPAWISSLPGMPHTAPADAFLGKDEIADYLQRYAARFDLPAWSNMPVQRLAKAAERFVVTANDQQFEADHIVVATGPYQHPRVPAFAAELDPAITQFHSAQYRNPEQVPSGDTLVVGVGSSGAEIALELAATHHVWLAGRDTGYRPKDIPLPLRGLYWWLLHRAINTGNRIGQRVKQQSEHRGAPLIGIHRDAFAHAHVERVPQVAGVRDGQPLLQDGRVLAMRNVIWATGFSRDYQWIDLTIFDKDGDPAHDRGVVKNMAGIYFVGLPFQYTLTSTFIGGVGRDARYVTDCIAAQPITLAASRLVSATVS